MPGDFCSRLRMSRPAAAAVAAQLVGAVGDALQLLEHEAGDDHRLVDHAGLGNVGDPAVDHDRGVEHERTRPFDLFREFHVGDDEPKVILGLQQRRDADVADEDHHEAREHHVHPGVQVELHASAAGRP